MECAFSALGYRAGPFRDYSERPAAAGKHTMNSLVAVARKLLATLHAILSTGRPYDPAFCPASAPLAVAA